VKFELRLVTSEDAEELADLQIAAWRAAFMPLMPADFEIPAREHFLLMGERSLQAEGVHRTVAVTSHHLVGLCTDGPSRDDDAPPEVGEIRALYVHPDHWREGVGAALAENALDQLRGSHFSEATLWSFRDNARANAFYERLGFRPDGSSRQRDQLGRATEVRLRRAL
jgi:RimJ/RimL family protein N-acetyltransferase